MKSPARVLLIDIEVSNLKATFGFILCVSYKWWNEDKVTTLSLPDFPIFQRKRTSDHDLLRALHKVIVQADIVVTYNGSDESKWSLDWPYVRTRMLLHPRLRRLKMPLVSHIDLLPWARTKLRLHRNSLETVARSLRLKHQKKALDPAIWVLAMSGDLKAHRQVAKHCEADVLTTEDLLNLVGPHMIRFPRVHPYGSCAFCGSERLNSRGYRITANRTKQRKLQCQDCGKWDSWGASQAA